MNYLHDPRLIYNEASMHFFIQKKNEFKPKYVIELTFFFLLPNIHLLKKIIIISFHNQIILYLFSER